MSGEIEALETLEAAFKAQLSDEWHVERSLTFAGTTADLLLVHPERGIVIVGLMTLRSDFDFVQFDQQRRIQAQIRVAEEDEVSDLPALEAHPGWDGLADPRDLMHDCFSELSEYLIELAAHEKRRLLRAVLLVVRDSDPVEANIVFGNLGRESRKDLRVEWLRKSPSDLSEAELQSLVTRVAPQAMTYEKPMPVTIWNRIKRNVLGIEDAVMGIAPPKDFRFDKKQQQILDYLSTPGLKRFQGPAGSGKTLIIARVVADCIKSGGRVLVVVYNKSLCPMIASRALFFVNEGVTDADERIRNTRLFNSNAFIAWQDRWWRRVCAETNLGRERRLIYAQNSSDPNGKALTEKEVARLSRSGLERARGLVADHLQYDVVIADEAQNMFPNNWEGLKLSTKEDSGVVAVSSDPTQSMYGSRPWTDQKMTGFAHNPWRKLNGSYRLPDDYLAFVADFIKRFPPDDEVNIPTPPEHPSLSGSTMYRIVSKSGYQKTAIAEAVQFAIDILQFLPHQVVILTATNDRGDSIVAELRRRGIAVTHTYDEAKRPTFGLEEGVRASTFHSYAGWESPCVIIDTDLDKKNTNPNGLLYSGVTRLAKRELGSAVIFVEGDNQYRDIIREYCEEIKY